MSNSDNPKKGADFQKQVQQYFINTYGPSFELEKKIPIGEPAKDHKFDIVSFDLGIVIECKRYTWTETGNVPSAKMGFTNEAAFQTDPVKKNKDGSFAIPPQTSVVFTE